MPWSMERKDALNFCKPANHATNLTLLRKGIALLATRHSRYYIMLIQTFLNMWFYVKRRGWRIQIGNLFSQILPPSESAFWRHSYHWLRWVLLFKIDSFLPRHEPSPVLYVNNLFLFSGFNSCRSSSAILDRGLPKILGSEAAFVLICRGAFPGIFHLSIILLLISYLNVSFRSFDIITIFQVCDLANLCPCWLLAYHLYLSYSFSTCIWLSFMFMPS